MTAWRETWLDRLVAAAREARDRAYAPYSKYRVGAALLTESGKIFAGCNVENASYGLTICAERGAIAQMVAAGENRPIACVVVVARGIAAAPCGACRQVLAEFNPAMEIVCVGRDERHHDATLSDLLPMRFGPHNLDSDDEPSDPD